MCLQAREFVALVAKRATAFRPTIGMRLPGALACLAAALSASPACFNPALKCRLICTTNNDCPGDLACLAGVCAKDGEICPSREDAGQPDASVSEAGSDGRPEARPAPMTICHKAGPPCIDL